VKHVTLSSSASFLRERGSKVMGCGSSGAGLQDSGGLVRGMALTKGGVVFTGRGMPSKGGSVFDEGEVEELGEESNCKSCLSSELLEAAELEVVVSLGRSGSFLVSVASPVGFNELPLSSLSCGNRDITSASVASTPTFLASKV